jgi:hypothetical protein
MDSSVANGQRTLGLDGSLYHPVAFSIGGDSVNSHAPSENFSLGQGQAPLLQKLPVVTEESSSRKTTFFGAVFLLMNAILGSGLLGQAYAASQSGVALYLVCLVVSAENGPLCEVSLTSHYDFAGYGRLRILCNLLVTGLL